MTLSACMQLMKLDKEGQERDVPGLRLRPSDLDPGRRWLVSCRDTALMKAPSGTFGAAFQVQAFFQDPPFILYSA